MLSIERDDLTTVGHSIMGVTIGALAIPPTWHPRVRASLLVGFAALVSVPDLRVPH